MLGGKENKTILMAVYDAEGLAGIINIVLITRIKDGYNGSVGINYNNTVGLGQNVSLTAKTKKLGVAVRSYVYQDFRMTELTFGSKCMMIRIILLRRINRRI